MLQLTLLLHFSNEITRELVSVLKPWGPLRGEDRPHYTDSETYRAEVAKFFSKLPTDS